MHNPGYADHLFQWYGVHFSGDTGISGRLGLDSVDDMPGTRGRLHRNTHENPAEYLEAMLA